MKLQTPNGAGDTFLGALAGYLTSLGKMEFTFDDICQAVIKGSILASFTCEEFFPPASCNPLVPNKF